MIQSSILFTPLYSGLLALPISASTIKLIGEEYESGKPYVHTETCFFVLKAKASMLTRTCVPK